MSLARRATLLAVVVLAAALRFTGLSWGLRHPVHNDERVYVENVVKMVEAGDFDHRFYTYPGFFYDLLAPGVWLLGPERWHGPDAYLVSRAFVSVFGVVNVGLAFFVGARLIAPAAGLAAALLMAVSPVAVQTSHEVRPDVVLETFGLLLLLGLRGVGERLRGDALMGVLIGLASAAKFTGLLMIPSYLAVRLTTPGRRVAGLALAGAVTIGVALACTPAALMHPREYSLGPPQQLAQYYPGFGPSFGANLGYFIRAEGSALGLGCLLLPFGLWLCLRRDPRHFGAALLHPIATLVVMSTGALVFRRYILPPMGLVCLFVAAPIAWLAEKRRPALAAALLLLAGALPFRESLAYVRTVSAPSAPDKALDWILAHVPAGARVVETRFDAEPSGRAGSMVGLDPRRYEMVHRRAADDRRALRLLAREMDLVITGPGAGGLWGEALTTLFEARGPLNDVVLQLKAPAARFVPRYRPLTWLGVRAAASENLAGLAALSDDDPATVWCTARPMCGREWIQLDFAQPVNVGRIEMFISAVPSRFDPELQLWTSGDGRSWELASAADARPSLLEQAAAGRRLSRLLILDPQPIRGVRILQLGARPEPLAINELRLDVALPGDSGG